MRSRRRKGAEDQERNEEAATRREDKRPLPLCKPKTFAPRAGTSSFLFYFLFVIWYIIT